MQISSQNITLVRTILKATNDCFVLDLAAHQLHLFEVQAKLLGHFNLFLR